MNDQVERVPAEKINAQYLRDWVNRKEIYTAIEVTGSYDDRIKARSRAHNFADRNGVIIESESVHGMMFLRYLGTFNKKNFE